MSTRGNVLILVSLLILGAAASFIAGPGIAGTEERYPGKVYRIGFLRAGPPPAAWVEAFKQGLREQGYVEGRNVVVEFRYTDGGVDQLPQLAAELVRLPVDVILASAPPSALAARQVTTSVPIVFPHILDPVELGVVASLAHPGGNLTGLALSSANLAGKRLELLREFVPTLRRVAVLSDPASGTNAMQLRGAEVAARTLGVQVEPVTVRGPDDFNSAFQTMRRVDGLLWLDSVLFTTHRARLAKLANTSRRPAIYGYREIVEAGGLMSYGAHFPDLYRRAASYVDKILKGAKPRDLPVEQPTKYEFVINGRTAKTLGLTIPPSLLFRADQVIE